MAIPAPVFHRQRRLWHFHGGLHLSDYKSQSNHRPVATADIPKYLVLPLQQHIGDSAIPLVKVGDRVLKGQLIARAQGYISAAIHASSSGTVTHIEERAVPHPSGFNAVCIVIETDGQDEWAELPKPLTDYVQRDPAELRERIRWAGIVGLGGAAFPTSVKLNPGKANPVHTLILNGAECEPYITCDDRLMREQANRVIQGAQILHHMVGAQHCLIGIEENKPEAIAAMRRAVNEQSCRHAEVIAIPTLYPSGGEKQLIRILTGQEVPSNGIPAQIGMVCQNVGTAAAVADAVLQGKPLISRIVTLTGEGIVQAGNFDVPVGTLAADLLAQQGGYSENVYKLILGGPMMGFTLSSDQVPITKATNCLLVASEHEAPDPGPASPCIRCGECARVCPVKLLPQQMYWYARSRDLDKIQDYHLFDCIECGCCSHVCPSHIPLVQYYRYAKTESWALEQEKSKAEHARRRHEARQARLERMEQERKAKLRKKKEVLQDKPRSGATNQDSRKAAIEAAVKRAAAKKAAQANDNIKPKNTEQLTLAQQRQIDAAEARRQVAEDAAAAAPNSVPVTKE